VKYEVEQRGDARISRKAALISTGAFACRLVVVMAAVGDVRHGEEGPGLAAS